MKVPVFGGAFCMFVPVSAKGVDCETNDKPTFDRKLWI